MRIIRYLDSSNKIGFAALNDDGSAAKITGDSEDFIVTDEPAQASRLLTPVDPRVIYCVGLNYRDHAEETGKPIPTHPMIFMKSPSAVQHPGSPIYLPRHLQSDEVDYEGELAVIIGRACKNVSAEDALDYVLGYTCANDVSARDWQYQWGGGQFCRAKTFDTFCPLGPCMVTPDGIPDPQKLTIRTIVNNEVLQNSRTDQMIFSVAELIAFLSGSTTLLPGTVILTGTPAGVGFGKNPKRFLKPGDEVLIEIDAIGTLKNPVFEEVEEDRSS